MLTILSELVDAMMTQARNDHPIETCGVIAGVVGSNQPSRLIPMRNVANSGDFFEFDSMQQLQVWREMDDRDEEPVVLYHSHTHSQAYPSREDVMLASEPNAHYIIIPTDPSFDRRIRSFRIVDGKIAEESVRMVERYEGKSNQ